LTRIKNQNSDFYKKQVCFLCIFLNSDSFRIFYSFCIFQFCLPHSGRTTRTSSTMDLWNPSFFWMAFPKINRKI